MNKQNTSILIAGISVLAVAILCLTIFKGNDMWKWMKKNVLCCFGKKEKVENNFERENREALEEYREGMNSDLKELKKEIHEYYQGQNKGLDRIQFLLENRPVELNENKR
jgi:hypothetical protein